MLCGMVVFCEGDGGLMVGGWGAMVVGMCVASLEPEVEVDGMLENALSCIGALKQTGGRVATWCEVAMGAASTTSNGYPSPVPMIVRNR